MKIKCIKGRVVISTAFFLVSVTGIFAQAPFTEPVYSWTNLPQITEPVFRKDTFNILSYGAKADGQTLNTKSINDAITACSTKGGGVVLIPGGLWLTGPVIMQNNVNLHVQRDAILQFTSDFNQYPLIEGNYEGRRAARNQSPLSGTNLQNIAITGKGIIDGNGDAWRMVTKDRLTESEWKKKVQSGGIVGDDGRTWYPSEKSVKGKKTPSAGVLENGKTLNDFADIKDFLRPNLLVFTGCKRVLLEGVTFQNSPAWCLHPLLCYDLTLRNVYAKNPEYAQNGDGVDVESCKNVLIEGCTFDVGDDGICIKSGRDEEGRRRGIPTENVVIRNSIVYKAHGGFVIGSEMSGGARNIFVTDCSFMGTDKGLRFKTTRGRGGLVEKIFVKNIYMKDIVGEAIFFDMYYFAPPPVAAGDTSKKEAIPPVDQSTPQFRDFHISNIVCSGAAAGVFMRGLPEMKVRQVFLDSIIIKAERGIQLIETADIHLNHIQLFTKKSDPLVLIENSSGLTFNAFTFLSPVDLLFKVSGSKSFNIQLTGSNFSPVKTKAAFAGGAESRSLTIK